jgi:phenylacetic acid degradation operon negative regulatory protein
MKAKTELLLYRLLWLAEKPLSRSYQNLEQSFEGWAYSNGLLNQIHQLEAQGWLESQQDPASEKRLHRLTEAGRAAVLDGRDPEKSWARHWDGKWRLFVFDIPESQRSKRRELNRALTKAGCGCLQGSVWIAPTAPPKIEKLVATNEPDCTHLLMLLADSKGPKVDLKMVEGAWNFNKINAAYQELQKTLDRFPDVAHRNSREALADWTAEESSAAQAALRLDPLLPSELLPKKYLARKIWRKRCRLLVRAAGLKAALSA